MRHLAALLAATLLVVALFFSIGLSRSFASTGHNCAPYPPPPLTGTLVNPAPTPGTLFINEVLLQPHSTWNCSETGGYFSTRDIWIELYNPQSQPLNLYAGHAFIDMGASIGNYYFPFGTAIAAHGFLVLFPFYNATYHPTVSVTFRLVIETTVIDQVTPPTPGPDQSYARTYDGGPTWQITAAPTIDASNGTTPITPVPQGGGSGSGGSGGGGSVATPTTSTHAIASGTQPAWGKLLLPAATATTAVPTTNINPTTLITSGSSPADGFDIGHRIALTLIVIIFIAVLFACWKWKLYKFRS